MPRRMAVRKNTRKSGSLTPQNPRVRDDNAEGREGAAEPAPPKADLSLRGMNPLLGEFFPFEEISHRARNSGCR